MSRTKGLKAIEDYIDPIRKKVYLANRQFSMCPLCRARTVATKRSDYNPHIVHGSCLSIECSAKWVLTLQVVDVQIQDSGPHKPLKKEPKKAKRKKKQPKKAESYG